MTVFDKPEKEEATFVETVDKPEKERNTPLTVFDKPEIEEIRLVETVDKPEKEEEKTTFFVGEHQQGVPKIKRSSSISFVEDPEVKVLIISILTMCLYFLHMVFTIK